MPCHACQRQQNAGNKQSVQPPRIASHGSGLLISGAGGRIRISTSYARFQVGLRGSGVLDFGHPGPPPLFSQDRFGACRERGKHNMGDAQASRSNYSRKLHLAIVGEWAHDAVSAGFAKGLVGRELASSAPSGGASMNSKIPHERLVVGADMSPTLQRIADGITNQSWFGQTEPDREC